jgi:hypothetical protein
MPKPVKSVQVHVRMTPEQHEELETSARHLGLPLSVWMLAMTLKESRLLPAGLVDAIEAPAPAERPKRRRKRKASKKSKGREEVLVNAE